MLDAPLERKLSITIRVVLAIASFWVLYYLSRANYLVFHSIVEGYCTVIGFAIFIQGWNGRRYMEQAYLLYLGIAYLFVGFFDFIHLLAYTGMGAFPGEGPNLPTQIWIASRYLQSLSLLTAFLFIKKRFSEYSVLAGFAVISALLIGSIFYWRVFPECYNPVSGLTTFKVVSEYIICAILIASLFILYLRRRLLDKKVRNLIYCSIILTILAELSFSQYTAIYGIVNMAGHMFKLLAFYCLYRAIVFTTFVRPFDLIFRDLQEKEFKLQDDLSTIKNLEEDRDLILSMLVHDMKTPLISIKGFSNLMFKNASVLDDSKLQSYLDVIQRQGGQLEKLIDDVLVSAQSSEKKLALSLDNYDIQDLLTDIAESFEGRCEAAGIEIKLDMPDEPVIATVDNQRLRRALANLLDNAIRFSPENGTITLKLSTAEDELFIEIADQGPGIPEKDIEEIFKPFYRGGTGQKDNSGYGLGLAGVRTIVESHGGRITAGNRNSRGALFAITIPYERPPVLPKKEAAPFIPDEELKQKRAQKRILVVEDNSVNRMMAMAVISKIGYESAGANSGQEAIKLLSSENYDLVLMDLRMPSMDGFATTKQIRDPKSSVINHDIPVLTLTASDNQAMRQEALQAGMNDYLSKPVEPGALAEALDRWLLADNS